MREGRPLVGITLHAEQREGVPERLVLNRAYIQAIEDAGGDPLCIPPVRETSALWKLFSLCDAL
ncbi:MAG TPA: gamma-glutamyl-gamma-aminobutyrate hydrolase family protein, partial [Candidatus Sulfotelmatobacter sp.]|nr:gamma-glutamyl-gamma-aminobutyrate hydrolase family protein [Candidatus Sulfotelmatobacter sp.]